MILYLGKLLHYKGVCEVEFNSSELSNYNFVIDKIYSALKPNKFSQETILKVYSYIVLIGKLWFTHFSNNIKVEVVFKLDKIEISFIGVDKLKYEIIRLRCLEFIDDFKWCKTDLKIFINLYEKVGG